MRPVVLFVDDEEAILEGLVRTLRGAPFDVITAASGGQAMEVLARTTVDVVVSDERMPNMSGTEFLRGVRQGYPEIVRIALTGEANLQTTTRFILEGEPYRFLSKPLQPSELLRTLNQAIGVRQRAQESARLRQGPPPRGSGQP